MKIVADSDKKVLPYNFKRPDRISKNQLRSLHFIHDRFARNFSSSVSAYLRTVVEVTLEETTQMVYSDFLSRTKDPTCFAALSLKPLDGSAAVEFEPEIIFPILERLLGGVGRPTAYSRPLTEIEQSIIKALFKLLVDNLKESWRPIYAIEFNALGVEVHPHLVQVVPPNEMVIHFQFNIRMRESMAKMHLVLPMMVLEPIIHIFDQEFHTRKRVVSDSTVLAQLRGTNVPVTIETRDTMFPANSLFTLQVGDTLVLDQREGAPLQLKVSGVAKFTSQTKKSANNKAFEITGVHRKFKEEKNGNY